MGKVVGIDLGTTNSLVAYVENGRPIVIRDDSGDALVPSVVSVGEDGTIFVGREAQRRLLTAPSRSVYSVKRFMGRGIEDVHGEAALLPFRVSGDPGGVVRIGIADRVFQVLSTNGDTHLGGDDIDRLLVEIVLEQTGQRELAAIETIRRAAIQAKWDLSDVEETEIRIEPSGAVPAGYRKRITRAEFERLIRPLIDRTLDPCRQALADAGLEAKDIDEA